MFELATKPGWKNFLFSILLWYLFITLFSLVNTTPVSLSYWYGFYTKFSWPNFLVVYITAFWIIPNTFRTRDIVKLFFPVILVLAVYILVRYVNHSLWEPGYYTAYDSHNVKYAMSVKDIISTELIRGIQFLVIGAAYGLFIERIISERAKIELEKSKLKSELASLRFQLNPHFLFNALNNIIFLQMDKSSQTLDALFKLAEILRYVLDEKHEWVSLCKEMQHIKNLISFEKIRYPDGLIIEDYQIEKGMEEYAIPPLLLATFIENAFKHGLQGTKEEPIHLSLVVTRQLLQYEITNPSKEPDNHNTDREGTGLENLKKRLELIYPGMHTMETNFQQGIYKSSLEIRLPLK
jgi:two-component system, LytTR family, sensor kinase